MAWHVLAHSILSRASIPVALIPLRQDVLRSTGIYTRERGPTESTDFSLTRFLVPYLSGYWGTSVFMDCDILCRADIADLLEVVAKVETKAMKDGQPEPAVLCCKHDYTPGDVESTWRLECGHSLTGPTASQYAKHYAYLSVGGPGHDAIRCETCRGLRRVVGYEEGGVKFLGNVQTTYPRKNWSSVMVFKNQRCSVLTPEYVNRATGLQLHRFEWIHDAEIGPLPFTWNYLVGEYEPNPEAKFLHWTLGGPWLPHYAGVDHADLWFAERDSMLGWETTDLHLVPPREA